MSSRDMESQLKRDGIKKEEINRNTIVTTENIDAVVDRLFAIEHPCLKSLLLYKIPENDRKRTLKLYLYKECVQDLVPLRVLIEGACVLKGAVVYYGKMSMQLLQMQAQAQGLPLFKRADIKYTIDCLKLLISKQGEYEKYLFDNIKKEKIDQDFVSFGSDEIYMGEKIEGIPPVILVPSGSYLISGAVGTLHFSDGNHIESHIRISRGDTKLENIFVWNGVETKKPTPYAKYPRAMIRIKFLRKGIQEFYGSMIKELVYDDDIEQVYVPPVVQATVAPNQDARVYK